MKQLSNFLFCIYMVICGACHGHGLWAGGWMSGEQCEAAINEIVAEDRNTVVDNSPYRLHSTWLSQDCEAKAGPEYVIRKYTFWKNGTFLLVRYHFAEESCSVPTHTVTATGVIRLLSLSGLAPGATETRYQLDHVHIIPLTRTAAHNLGHKVNTTCTMQPRWRPYVQQVIYEQSSQRSSNALWVTPNWYPNVHSRNDKNLDCLDTLGINYDELNLVRVQYKPATSTAFGLGENTAPRVELLLGSLPPNGYARKYHRSTSLQPTILLRMDTTSGCLMCGALIRATEYSPPLLHQVVALPALLGGFWISSACESCKGGLWIKRQLQFYPGDVLWTARWDYYSDPKCAHFLYAVMSTGSYIQRPGRQRRYINFDKDEGDLLDNVDQIPNFDFEEMPDQTVGRSKRNLEKNELLQWQSSNLAKKLLDIHENKYQARGEFFPIIQEISEAKKKTTIIERQPEMIVVSTTVNPPIDVKSRRSLDPQDSYRHLLDNSQPSMAESFAAMLKGNQRPEETKRLISLIPTGTTELDLHVAESLLIIGDMAIATRCRAQIVTDELEGLKVRPMSVWPRHCVKHALEAPSTLGLRARVGVNWSGQYTLLLGLRDDSLWEAPLRQCSPTPAHNPILKSHLRQSLGYSYGLLPVTASATTNSSWFLHPFIHYLLYKVFV